MWFFRLGSSLVLLSILTASAAAQSTARLLVRVLSTEAPLAGVAVRSDTAQRITDAQGLATFQLHAGLHRVRLVRVGYLPDSLDLTLAPGADTTVTVTLQPVAAELEELIVTSTRSPRRVEDQPLRIEVLGTEEVEEKLLMTPGDITMLLNETPGIRIQGGSSTLGSAAIRIQGLRGRYAAVLSDGLPLFGAQVGGLGPLQIPPMDLGQVEVIKGAAAALYGPAALGGVINLISRDQAPGTDLLFNATSLGGVDAIAFARGAWGGEWRPSLLVGLHRQARHDRNSDGFGEIPGYERIVVRPRLRWSDQRGRSLLLIAGTTVERRRGGTVGRATAPDGEPFVERLDSDRADAGAVVQWPLGPGWTLAGRASAAGQWHRHTFGFGREPDRHVTGLAEATVSRRVGRVGWLVGGATGLDSYRSRVVRGMDYRFVTPAGFAQVELDPNSAVALAGSVRVDRHGRYGTFVSPRISALVRPGGTWQLRLGGGTGFFAPTPFVDQTEQVGLSLLQSWDTLRAERAVSGSADLGAVFGGLEVHLGGFASSIRHAVQPRASGKFLLPLELINAAGPTRAAGGDALVRLRAGDVTLTSSYTFTATSEPNPEGPGRRPIPLTPRHAASLVATWERESWGRVGLEVYYTGRQSLESDQYRPVSRPFTVVGLLVERVLGPVRVFVNGENLTDRRQSRVVPLVRPSRAIDGRWTTDAWGSLEGRVVNVGVRVARP